MKNLLTPVIEREEGDENENQKNEERKDTTRDEK